MDRNTYEALIRMTNQLVENRSFAALASVSEIQPDDEPWMRRVRRYAAARHAELVDEYQRRRRQAAKAIGERVQQMIDEHGVVFASKFERDCDLVETHKLYTFHSHDEFFAFRRDSYEYAEGPVRWDVLTPEQAAEFEPSYRDRIMEAFENGRAFAIML